MLNIDDILKEKTEQVQTFKKVEEKAKKVGQPKKVGRPKKNQVQKAKPRVLYYTDDEFEEISKIAKLYNLSSSKYLKMIIQKEINREKII